MIPLIHVRFAQHHRIPGRPLMAAAIKGTMLLASTLLLGSGVYRYWLEPRTTWRFPMIVAWLGGLMLLAASTADLHATLSAVVGPVDLDLLWRYMTSTRHGDAVLVRFLTVAVLLAVLGWRTPRWTATVFVPAGLVLLGTFSYTSHAAAMGGTMPLLGDLVHFVAAAGWAGAIFHLAVSPLFQPERREALLSAMRRVSLIGLAAVLLLFATGIYTSLIHMGEPARFIDSPYGAALLLKVILVLVVVGIAALNRFVFLPALERGTGPSGLRNTLFLEAVLLVTIFAATGLLSTSALPHGADASIDPVTNLSRLIDYLRR